MGAAAGGPRPRGPVLPAPGRLGRQARSPCASDPCGRPLLRTDAPASSWAPGKTPSVWEPPGPRRATRVRSPRAGEGRPSVGPAARQVLSEARLLPSLGGQSVGAHVEKPPRKCCPAVCPSPPGHALRTRLCVCTVGSRVPSQPPAVAPSFSSPCGRSAGCSWPSQAPVSTQAPLSAAHPRHAVLTNACTHARSRTSQVLRGRAGS